MNVLADKLTYLIHKENEACTRSRFVEMVFYESHEAIGVEFIVVNGTFEVTISRLLVDSLHGGENLCELLELEQHSLATFLFPRHSI